jgi:hypothetical protein
VEDIVSSGQIATARRLAILAIGVWFVAAVIAGVLGVVNEPGRPPLVLLSFFVLPIVGFVAAYWASPSFRAFTETIPLALLVGSHLWRFVGVGFVIGWLTGALPAGFGIPEGFGDIIAALGALLLLPKVRKGTASRGWLLAWNIFGTIDLLSAITVGLLFSQSKLGVLSTATSNTVILATFPVSIIPTFFVPLFLLVHALTFKRIAGMGQSTRSGRDA